jgi:hypothetical protein
MMDDIVERLRYQRTNSVICNEAASEIERLREQVRHAHAILSSEAACWLVVGSNHEESWRETLDGTITSYWEKYGSFFRASTVGANHD